MTHPMGRLVILAVDDDPADLELLNRHLMEIAEFDAELLRASNARKAVDMIVAHTHIDVIILDYMLGAQTGLDLLKEIRSRDDIRPIIMLTGRGDEYVATALVRAGADDYIVKADLTAAMLRRAISTARARFEKRRAQCELAKRDEVVERLS